MDDIIDLVSLSDEELKKLIGELTAEEHDVSRQRRILHGKIDIMRAELVLRLQRHHEAGESIITADDVTGCRRSWPASTPWAMLAKRAGTSLPPAETRPCSARTAGIATRRASTTACAAAPA